MPIAQGSSRIYERGEQCTDRYRLILQIATISYYRLFVSYCVLLGLLHIVSNTNSNIGIHIPIKLGMIVVDMVGGGRVAGAGVIRLVHLVEAVVTR
jgi:hypothetical protein